MKKRKRKTLGLSSLVIIFAVLGFLANGAYQLAKKPADVVSLVGLGESKSPQHTWLAYKDSFRTYSTPLMTAEFLASLAFVESSGNPLATPPWVLRLTSQWDQVFSPATSAVGLFQFTEGTFELAQELCNASSKCPSSWFYSRLWPDHSIKLASHYLDSAVSKLLKNSGVNPTMTKVRHLASVIHLCGEKKGQQLVRNNFSLHGIKTCGAHSVAGYVNKVEHLHRRFVRLSSKNFH